MTDNTPDSKLIAKIKALLETRGCTEAEAQARTAKAQELLEKYNLDMAVLGQSGKGAQRTDTKKSGGLYSWQRRLWDSVAKLNFCYYLSIKGLARGSVYEHRIIGSHANVIATEMMAQYLQETVERLAQQWAKDNFYKSVFVREAIAYREGMAARLSERLNERRQQVVSEARKAEQERKQAAARAEATPGTNALTILDVISTEEDFNNDYLNNWELGTTARNRRDAEARYEEALRRYRAAEAAKSPEQKKREAEELAERMKQWEKEAARNQARRNKTPPKPRYRKPTAEEERMGLGSYYEGRRSAEKVSIDQQVSESAPKRRLA